MLRPQPPSTGGASSTDSAPVPAISWFLAMVEKVKSYESEILQNEEQKSSLDVLEKCNDVFARYHQVAEMILAARRKHERSSSTTSSAVVIKLKELADFVIGRAESMKSVKSQRRGQVELEREEERVQRESTVAENALLREHIEQGQRELERMRQELLQSNQNPELEAPEGSPLFRQLSNSSRTVFGEVNRDADAERSKQIFRVLIVIKTANEMGLISQEEKQTLKDQLVRGNNYDETILRKLTRGQERCLNSERVSRFQIASNSFVCPITAEVMTDPVVCADGHSYERDAIEDWLRR